MPPFPKPSFQYQFDFSSEIHALKVWRDTKQGRAIPAKQDGKFLLGSWNIANLGDRKQRRDTGAIRIISEIISWFDVVAVQEVKESLHDFRRIMLSLPDGYEAVFSDVAGNDERMVFIYDGKRVKRMELAGEIAVAPASHRHIRLPGIQQKFKGFDRNPFAVAFELPSSVFTIVNAHLYFGSSSKQSENRRALETYAVGRWADLRMKRGDAYSGNTVVIGDLNMPAVEPGDKIYDALVKRGLRIPEHQSSIGTVITGNKYYDQLSFFPGEAGQAFVKQGVFDFDGAVFRDLWQQRTSKEFDAYVRFHISDHRPIWAQFDI
ncbi:endonuclease/exonuclease/phosphatase family protein [Roseibium sp.]|uniref:endonuclease/exonuclease/phosphatase family protein n=1 Tax=Roseibium sp. TaxID=1936156 RepID=UPI00391C9C73